MPTTPRKTPPSRGRPRPASALASVLALALAGACMHVPAGEATPPTEAAEEPPPPTIFWPGRGPGELYQPGEVRAFVLRRGKIVIGHSWGRYDGPTGEDPGEHRFSTRVEINLPGRDPLRSAGEIVVDDRGELLRGFEQSGQSRLNFDRDEELMVFTDGHQREELSAAPGTAFMAFSAIFHEELMLGLRELRGGELGWRLISLSGSLPIEWSATVDADPERPEVARLTTGLGEVIAVDKGRIVSIDIADEALQIRPVPARWPEWELTPPKSLSYEPAKDATFRRREVELPGRSGEPRLHGEVLLPASASKGPRPAALFLGGNGQQDRHGFAGPPPVDLGSHQITDALAEAGFVVLRFDERGHGASEAAVHSYALQLEDARRALRTLLTQPEVDPDRVVLVGHGESGWRALQLAAEDRHIAAVALLGVPGRRYHEVLREQAEADIATLPPAMQKRAREEHQKLVDALVKGGEVPPAFASMALWAREILAVDPAALIARVEAPIWAAQGDKDFEVDPERDPAALQAHARKHRKKLRVRRYPGLDHLFKPEAERSTPARYLDPEGPRDVDPGFLRDLVEFVDASTAPPRSSRTRGRTSAR